MSMVEPAGSSSPNAMVDRVVLIMNAFKGSRARLGLADVVEATGLPRSSAHRILQQLAGAGWLEREHNGYRLGLGIFELGALVGYRSRITHAARPLLRELSAGRYVAHLAVLDGTDVVYLDKVAGATPARLPSRVGGRVAAHATGVGKAILAHSSNEIVDAYIARGLERYTSTTLTEPGELLAELSRIRTRGAAFDDGEAVPGVSCVAVPIFDRGAVHAAVSVCAAAESLDVQSLQGRVRATAAAIERRLAEARLPAPST
ncbi:IclR family transcriptional regulator [Salinibacterium sp. ZJ70]|uniref:IclR family transcriptional regulator n=1 Tax=Salinibacterium sp. ZJ70 TaxID=2708084 RepID=UPI001CD5ABD2|nr:IclR family transcriptional regulator [Salinibacterium sp. ZJ70]